MIVSLISEMRITDQRNGAQAGSSGKNGHEQGRRSDRTSPGKSEKRPETGTEEPAQGKTRPRGERPVTGPAGSIHAWSFKVLRIRSTLKRPERIIEKIDDQGSGNQGTTRHRGHAVEVLDTPGGLSLPAPRGATPARCRRVPQREGKSKKNPV
ncbi:hypothetical protein ES708_06127 [subsurface metagenome]